MAIPWQDIQDIHFSPPIPKELYVPDDRHRVTSFTARYMEPQWRIFGFSGSFMSHAPHVVGYETRTQTISGFIYHNSGNNNLYTEQMLKNDVLKSFRQQFGRHVGVPMRWQHKTFEQAMLRGLPPTTAWKRIIWAGTNSAVHYRGFANGAVQAGMRAALYALLDVRPQTIDWHDIDEIQHANVVHERINWIDECLASCNLYNCTFYALIIPTIYGCMFAAYKYYCSYC